MNKKRIAIIIIIGVIAITVIGVIAYTIAHANDRTGEEWFFEQEEYADQMTEWTSSLDDIITLYAIDSISSDDLVNHLQILDSELFIMESAYNQDLRDHPVKTGTHTYASKRGCEAIEDCFADLSEMLVALADVADDPSNVLYYYYTYENKFMDDYCYYLAAVEAYALAYGDSEDEEALEEAHENELEENTEEEEQEETTDENEATDEPTDEQEDQDLTETEEDIEEIEIEE